MKRLLLFAVVATLFAACTQDIVVDVTNPTIADNTPETLVIGFEDDETRIQLNEDVKTVWTKGDLVSVFYRSDANQKWHYQGETGERVAELTQLEAGVATEAMKRVVVVYPYSENYYINTETYNVQATLPAVQNYLKDSYGLDGNIMISSSEYNNFSLKSVCGWLKLQLTGNGEKVKSITLRGNNGEQVAGELYINSADATATLSSDTGSDDDGETGGAGGGLVFEDTILKEVTLDCGEGVTLGKEATAFYIALPPQTFDGGITVEIATTDGATMTKSTNNSIVIERNHIQPMTTFVYDGVRPQPNNEIWYTATAKISDDNSWYSWNSPFGSRVTSHTFDAETGKGVITFNGNVTRIPERAFTSWNLKSINIPESVTTIEEGAFYGAYNIETFNGKFAADGGRILVSNGTLIAFASNCGVIKYTIPEDITKIGKGAFYNSDRLVNVEIGDNVTTIGSSAFNDCSGLNDVTIPDNVTTLLNFAFGACNHLKSVTIGSGVTSIEYDAFMYCNELSRVYIKATTPPTAVTHYDSYVGDHVWYAFDYVASCLEIYVPAESVAAYKNAEHWSRYDYAFAGYDFQTGEIVVPFAQPANNEIWYAGYVSVDESQSMTTFGANIISEKYNSATGRGVITFDRDVTKIGERAFEYSSCTIITIPNSVMEIGNGAFQYCTNLKSITIPNGVTTIGYYAFSSCSSLKEFRGKFAADGGRCLIKDNVIIAYANTSGTTYNIPDSVTAIEYYAFYGCDNLKSVTISDSITEIGGWAFCGCSNLTSVTIPGGVTSIGKSAFLDCTRLETVNCKPTTPPIGDKYMFDDNASGRKIYVPSGSISRYRSAQYWSDYASYIYGNASL